jgi:cardiolipin synthase
MLQAIRNAKTRVLLASYIFDSDKIGREFIDALAGAVERGVTVRVLIDGFGSLYSWPSAYRLMKRRGIPVARFLPPKLLPPSFYLNLRNHRKILIADGEIGFTGGMNIREHHMLAAPGRHNVADVHFRLKGPVVQQIERVFRRDWQFSAGEPVHAPTTRSAEPTGQSLCRVIEDGPGENLDKLPMILVGAVAAAQKSIEIMTPYFLPPDELVGALQTAALRGVHTSVILPARNNLFYVHWATRNMLWQLLQRGVRIYYQPAPFVHSKLFIIDGEYAQIGSANLDPRSLRLNFELNVEIFDAVFVHSLVEYFETARSRSAEISLEAMDGRRLSAKFRDALAWLFTPYL